MDENTTKEARLHQYREELSKLDSQLEIAVAALELIAQTMKGTPTGREANNALITMGRKI